MAERDVAQALSLAETAAAHLRGAGQRVWFERLDAEYEALRSALRSCERHADAETGLRLAVTLAWFWFRRGHVPEGRRWLEGFLAAAPASEDGQRLRPTGLFWAGHFACAEVKPDEARPFLEESLAISTVKGDARGIAYALKGLGHAAWYRGDYQGSMAQQREAVRLLALTGDQWGQAWTLGQLAGVTYDMGDHAAALGVAHEALALFRTEADPWGCAWTLDTLGAILLFDGDRSRSRPYFEESVGIWRALGSKHDLAYSLLRLGRGALLDGDVARAAASFGESQALFREVGWTAREAGTLHDLGCVALAQGNTAQATAHFTACLEQHRAAGAQAAAADALYALGQVALAERDYPRADALFAELLVLAREIGDQRRTGQALQGAGHAALGQGVYRLAAAHLRASLTHWRQVKAEHADRDRGANLAYGQRVALERDLEGGRALAALLADVAALAAVQGQPERAVWLWAAGQGQVEQPAWWLPADTRHDLAGVIRAPAMRAHYQALAARTRAQLGEAAYDAAWTAGQAMTLEQAIAYAFAGDDGA